MPKNLRAFYIWISLLFAAVATIFAYAYPSIVESAKDKAAYYGGLASILGLIIAILEIIQVRSRAEEIKTVSNETRDGILNLVDITKLERGIASVTTIRSEIVAKQYGKAAILLQELSKGYGTLVDRKEFGSVASTHRRNYDNIGIINNLLDMHGSSGSELSEEDRKKCFDWLSEISQEMIISNQNKMGR